MCVDIEDAFAALADKFGNVAGVTLPRESGGRGFGSTALEVDGSIFAMVSHGRLTVKLPRDRVAELIESRTGLPFDAGKGRPMKEWVSVAEVDPKCWLELAREACAFVGTKTRKSG